MPENRVARAKCVKLTLPLLNFALVMQTRWLRALQHFSKKHAQKCNFSSFAAENWGYESTSGQHNLNFILLRALHTRFASCERRNMNWINFMYIAKLCRIWTWLMIEKRLFCWVSLDYELDDKWYLTKPAKTVKCAKSQVQINIQTNRKTAKLKNKHHQKSRPSS